MTDRNEVLERMGFKPLVIHLLSCDVVDMVNGYGKYGGNGRLVIHDDKTFNLSCHSSVFDEICADIAELRKEGVLK